MCTIRDKLTCALSFFVHGLGDGCAHLAPLLVALAVLCVLVRVQGPQQTKYTDHLTAHVCSVLSLQEVEQDVKQVWVLVVGLNHIATRSILQL